MTGIMEFYRKERKILLASAIAGIVFTICFGYYTKCYSETVQAGIAKEVVRLHVLANSDSEEDQELKQIVRDGVLSRFRQDIEAAADVEETKAFLSEHMAEITKCAKEIVAENGYDYEVSASLDRDFFPTKIYGDVTFPAGEYDALRIIIGSGAGQNWWCVMFPPLCYVDVTKKQIPEEYKKELKNLLSEEEYKLIDSKSDNSGVTVKVKFKIVEWWMDKKKDRQAKQYASLADPFYHP